MPSVDTQRTISSSRNILHLPQQPSRATPTSHAAILLILAVCASPDHNEDTTTCEISVNSTKTRPGGVLLGSCCLSGAAWRHG